MPTTTKLAVNTPIDTWRPRMAGMRQECESAQAERATTVAARRAQKVAHWEGRLRDMAGEAASLRE